MKRHSIKTKITLWLTGLTVVLCLLLVVFLLSISRGVVVQTTRERLTQVMREQAKAVALAQVKGAGAEHIREFELDRDDGRVEYEGKILFGGMEYEFEIDGYSGAIRNWEVERAGRDD